MEQPPWVVVVHGAPARKKQSHAQCPSHFNSSLGILQFQTDKEARAYVKEMLSSALPTTLPWQGTEFSIDMYVFASLLHLVWHRRIDRMSLRFPHVYS